MDDVFSGVVCAPRDAGPWPQNRGLSTSDWVARVSFGAQLIADEGRAGAKPIAYGPCVADAVVGPSRGAGVVADATQPTVRRGVAA